jgi:hypothetical protein
MPAESLNVTTAYWLDIPLRKYRESILCRGDVYVFDQLHVLNRSVVEHVVGIGNLAITFRVVPVAKYGIGKLVGVQSGGLRHVHIYSSACP